MVTIISISLHKNPPTIFEEVSSLIQRKCDASQFAIRATSHDQYKFSPGEMTFCRNTLHLFSTQVNWDKVLRQKQILIDRAYIRELRIEDSIITKSIFKCESPIKPIIETNWNLLPYQKDPEKLFKCILMVQCPFKEGNILNPLFQGFQLEWVSSTWWGRMMTDRQYCWSDIISKI